MQMARSESGDKEMHEEVYEVSVLRFLLPSLSSLISSGLLRAKSLIMRLKEGQRGREGRDMTAVESVQLKDLWRDPEEDCP